MTRCGKTAYKNRDTADRGLKRAKEQGRAEVRVYHCGNCNSYHLSTVTAEQQEYIKHRFGRKPFNFKSNNR